MNPRRRSSSGAALPAALAALMLAAALAAALAGLGQVELALVRNRRAAAAALAAADGCLAELLANLPAGWETFSLPTPPAACGASITPLPTGALIAIAAEATGATRKLEAVVARAATPGPDALLWLGIAPAAGVITGAIVLDGVVAGAVPWVSLAAPVPATQLDQALAALGAHALVSAPTRAPRFAPPPPVLALAARLAAGPGVHHFAGDLILTGTMVDSGVLLVDGLLDIRGNLDISGVVIASGLQIRSGGTLRVAGALWVAGSTFEVAGQLSIRAEPAAMLAADNGGSLPRLVRLRGLRDRE